MCLPQAQDTMSYRLERLRWYGWNQYGGTISDSDVVVGSNWDDWRVADGHCHGSTKQALPAAQSKLRLCAVPELAAVTQR
jgi:hypothetical protein